MTQCALTTALVAYGKEQDAIESKCAMSSQPKLYVAMTEDGPIISPDLEQVVLDLRDTYEAIEWSSHVNSRGHTVLTLTTEGEDYTVVIYPSKLEGIPSVQANFANALLAQPDALRAAA